MKTYAHFIFNDKTKVVITNQTENDKMVRVQIIDEYLNSVTVEAPKLEMLNVEKGSIKSSPPVGGTKNEE